LCSSKYERKQFMNESTTRIAKPGFFRGAFSGLAAALTSSREVPSRPQLSATSSIQSSAKKILVVDDDPVILKAMSAKLGGYGYKVITANDGSEAIATMRDEKPDLIVLDVNFPPDVANGGRVTWDGFQIMSWLRGLKEADGTPFVIVTSGDPKEYK